MIILRSKSFATDSLDALAELPNGQEERGTTEEF